MTHPKPTTKRPTRATTRTPKPTTTSATGTWRGDPVSGVWHLEGEGLGRYVCGHRSDRSHGSGATVPDGSPSCPRCVAVTEGRDPESVPVLVTDRQRQHDAEVDERRTRRAERRARAALVTGAAGACDRGEVLPDPRTGPTDRAVLRVLVERAGVHSDEVTLGRDDLAARSGVSARTVERGAVPRLVAAGYVQRLTTGKGSATTYRVDLAAVVRDAQASTHPALTADPDVARVLGSRTAAVYGVLIDAEQDDPDGPGLTPAQVRAGSAVLADVPRSTVTRALANLAGRGMAEQTEDGRWRASDGSLADDDGGAS